MIRNPRYALGPSLIIRNCEHKLTIEHQTDTNSYMIQSVSQNVLKGVIFSPSFLLSITLKNTKKINTYSTVHYQKVPS